MPAIETVNEHFQDLWNFLSYILARITEGAVVTEGPGEDCSVLEASRVMGTKTSILQTTRIIRPRSVRAPGPMRLPVSPTSTCGPSPHDDETTAGNPSTYHPSIHLQEVTSAHSPRSSRSCESRESASGKRGVISHSNGTGRLRNRTMKLASA
jgi:hypothetical protein